MHDIAGASMDIDHQVPTTPRTRRFELHRDHDVSKISGEGVVADGVLYGHAFILPVPGDEVLASHAGACKITWRGDRPSVVFWRSIDDAVAIHGHNGSTRFVFTDEDEQGAGHGHE